MNYTVVNSIFDATHWIAKESGNFNEIIEGKIYPLIHDLNEQEVWIVDEKGYFSMIYLVVEGDYIKHEQG